MEISQEPTATPSPSPTPTADPLVTTTVPSSFTGKKILLFPFEIPAYAIRAATFPLLSLSKYMERKGLFELTPRDWILLPLIQAGGGWGFGGGVFFQYTNIANSGYFLQAHYRIFTDADMKGALLLKSPPVLYLKDRPIAYRFKARLRDRNDDRFFGIGSGTPSSAKSFFTNTKIGAGLAGEILVLPSLGFTVPVDFLTANTSPSRSSISPSVQTVFPPDELTGFGQRLNYLVFGLDIEYDTRNAKFIPNRGAYYALKFSRFQGLNTTQFDFNQLMFDFRHYFPLWTPNHVLALRHASQFQTGNVPFYLLSLLDWHTFLRGFSQGRFRDKAYVLFNLEYRFPVWDFLQGNVFVDTGKVFNGIKNFNFDDWRYSVGGGLSLFFRDILIVHFQAGYGGEGAQLIFRMGPAI